MDSSTIQGLASEASAWFESALRDERDSESRFDRLKEGHPEWVSDLVYAAHGDFLPDDWRYATIRNALEFVAETDAPEDSRGEFADSAVDVYTSARLAWLGSNLQRPGYCAEAAAEFGFSDDGRDDQGIIDRIALGQYFEADEVYGLVLQALEARLEEVGDDDAL